MNLRPDFFPDVAFGWVFYAVLVSILIAATIIDFRGFTIPRKLSVACLALGVSFNVGRGLWLGLQDKAAWMLPAGPVWGAFDGLLFSVAGFALAFAVFFGLWFLKACGGGDVKLYAAAGAWMGPKYWVFVLIATVAIHVVVAIVIIVSSMFTSGLGVTQRRMSAAETNRVNRGGRRPKHRGMTYSFPLALATSVILLVALSTDLGLRPRNDCAVAIPVSQAR